MLNARAAGMVAGIVISAEEQAINPGLHQSPSSFRNGNDRAEV
jgi:hypothetical protein